VNATTNCCKSYLLSFQGEICIRCNFNPHSSSSTLIAFLLTPEEQSCEITSRGDEAERESEWHAWNMKSLSLFQPTSSLVYSRMLANEMCSGVALSCIRTALARHCRWHWRLSRRLVLRGAPSRCRAPTG
jgi:hypothetical protein